MGGCWLVGWLGWLGGAFSVSESEIGLCSESNMGHKSKMGSARAGSKYMDGDKPAPP